MGDPRERLEQFRSYLLVLAEWHLPPRFRQRVGPEDMVQQAFTQAVRAWEQFRGESEGELCAWLRRILHNVLTDTARGLTRPGQDTSRERSLEQSLEGSSAHLERFLAADQSSPSQKLMKEERLRQLAGALAQLTGPQRTAVHLRHLRGLSLSEISEEMGRSQAAVGGLLRDGLRALRRLLGDDSSLG